MSDHLPECERWFTNMPDSDECPTCEMFRACEQRVSSEFLTPMALAFTGMSDPRYAKGYADGLDAAREAVAAAVSHRGGYHSAAEYEAVAIAAIDALRQEKK